MKENSIEEETISSNHDSPLKKVLYSENIFNHLKDEKNNEKPNKLSKSYKINISKDTINKENEDMKYNFGIFPDKKDLDSPQNKIKEKENSSPNEFKEFKFTLLKMIDDDIKNNFQNKSLLNNNNYDLINNSFINNEKETNSNFFLNNIFMNKDSNSLKQNLDSSLNEEMNNLNLDNNLFNNKHHNSNENSKNKIEQNNLIHDIDNKNNFPLFKYNNDFNIMNNNNFILIFQIIFILMTILIYIIMKI